MRSHIHSFALLLLFLAANKAAADSKFIKADSGNQPNHLVPVSPTLTSYDKLIARKLLVVGGDCGTFIFRPSFSGEMAVAVYGTDYMESYPREARRFFITVTKAAKNLYYKAWWMPSQISRQDVEIDRELAVAVQRAWASMLLRTSYHAYSYEGLDGYTAAFSVFVVGVGQIHGEIWTPTHGLPQEMVSLGFTLKQFAESPVKERSALRLKLLGQLRSFERRARKP